MASQVQRNRSELLSCTSLLKQYMEIARHLHHLPEIFLQLRCYLGELLLAMGHLYDTDPESFIIE